MLNLVNKYKKMSKWINDRFWKVSVYISFIIVFIVFCVSGYHYSIEVIGNTSLVMRTVVLICICLFFALIMSLVFSVFVTPVSELLLRILKRFQRKKIMDKHTNEQTDVQKYLGNNTDIGEETIIGKSLEDTKTLRSQFQARFVTDEHKKDPIYDVIYELLKEKKEGAFAAFVIGLAADEPLKWLKEQPTPDEMKRYFGEDAIKSDSAFGNGKNKYLNPLVSTKIC